MLWGTHIGTVALADGERVARFEYTPEFLSSGIEVAPLNMPLAARVYMFPELAEQSFHGLPGLLADSLPDKFGNAVIDSWLVGQGRQPGTLNAVERLCYTGVRGMGALEFLPTVGPDAREVDAVQVEALTQLANRILEQREAVAMDADEGALRQILRVGTSAGGARAKAIVAWNESTGEIRSGQVNAGEGFGYWLLKFDGVASNADKEDVDDPQYTCIEYAYHLMARAAGITMSECRLYCEGGRRHFMTRRFDRELGTGEKLHMQTLGALAHFDFNVPGANSYEQAAGVLQRLGMGRGELEELFRRMVFNVVARNQDDHVKNISFLMDRQGVWSLAPAYDVTYAYNPGGLWTGSHQMTVNGKRDAIGRDDCLRCAEHMNLRAARAESIIEQIVTAVRSWADYAEAAGLREDTARRIARAHVLWG